MKEYPKYVKLHTKETAFRLRGDMYWCDSGEWGFSFREGPTTYSAVDFEKQINLYSVSHMRDLNHLRIIAITEDEWLKKTSNYIPIGYVFEDGSKWDGKSSTYDDYSEDEYGNMIDSALAMLDTEPSVVKIDTNYKYLLIQA